MQTVEQLHVNFFVFISCFIPARPGLNNAPFLALLSFPYSCMLPSPDRAAPNIVLSQKIITHLLS